jgi:hypothetical protein
VPLDQPAGKLKVVVEFDSGPLAGALRAESELALAP